jgi:hypothetical protein
MIVGIHFSFPLSFYIFLPSFECSFYSSLWLKWEMVFSFPSYFGWLHVLIIVMRDKEEETKLVEGFTKATVGHVTCVRTVALLREVLAKIVGVVVEVKNSPCSILLPKAVLLAGARLLPGGSAPSIRFFSFD